MQIDAAQTLILLIFGTYNRVGSFTQNISAME